jgi:hypothetical protein
MKPNGTTQRTAASSGAPRGADLAELGQKLGRFRTAPLASPRPKYSLLLITLRDSGSRIGTRYPPGVVRRSPPHEEEGSGTADSVTLLMVPALTRSQSN